MTWCLIKRKDNFTFAFSINQGIDGHKGKLTQSALYFTVRACVREVRARPCVCVQSEKVRRINMQSPDSEVSHYFKEHRVVLQHPTFLFSFSLGRLLTLICDKMEALCKYTVQITCYLQDTIMSLSQNVVCHL
jgi:hypothetical protein